MRRKKLEYDFRQSFEWLESPENHGLILPFHRLFCPNLSKSAPCKCCPGGTQSNNCTDCTTAFNTNSIVYIDDSIYGANVTNFDPSLTSNATATVTVSGYSNSTDCASSPPAPYSISLPITYEFGCVPGSPSPPTPSRLTMGVRYPVCNANTGMRNTLPYTLVLVSATSLNLPQFCDLSSSLVFTISAEGNFSNGNPKLYPSGATITYHR